MRYLLYKLKWLDGKGYGPESIAAENKCFLEASAFYTVEGKDSVYLGFLTGNLALENLADFEAIELQQQEALTFAASIYQGSSLLESGKIVPPVLPLADA